MLRFIPAVSLGVCLMCSDVHSTPLGDSLTAFEKDFVKTEALADPYRRVQNWKQMILAIEQGDQQVNPVINLRVLQYNVVVDYMSLYGLQPSEDVLHQAYEFVRSIDNYSERVWSQLYVLDALKRRVAVKQDSLIYGMMKRLIDDVVSSADMLTDKRERGFAYYALADVMTRFVDNAVVFKPAELNRVTDFIQHFVTDQHRLAIMKAYVEMMSYVEQSVYPSRYTALYDILDDGGGSSQELSALHIRAQQEGDRLLALQSLQAINDRKMRDQQLNAYFESLMEKGLYSQARKLAEAMENEKAAARAWSKLAIHYMRYDYVKKSDDAYYRSLAIAKAIVHPDRRENTLNMVEQYRATAQQMRDRVFNSHKKLVVKLTKKSTLLSENNDTREVVDFVKGIQNDMLRVKIFEGTARYMSESYDAYNILRSNVLYSFFNGAEHTIESPGSIGVQVRNMIPAVTGAKVSVYPNIKYANAQAPYHFNYVELPVTSASFIVIESGVADIGTIYNVAHNKGEKNCITYEDGGYTLHCPIVIEKGASLVVTGDSVKQLRLSGQSGVYISNAGELFLSDTQIIGWDLEQQSPMHIDNAGADEFRPFIASHHMSNTVIANSVITSLGYEKSPAYGLTFTAHTDSVLSELRGAGSQSSSALIVNNSFNNLFYGLASYGSANVIAIGNEYVGSVGNAIDLSGDAGRLFVGYNAIHGGYGTQGIALHNESRDALIAGNLIFDNAGAAITVNNNAKRNITYANTFFSNEKQGIVISESDCGIYASNRILDNKNIGFEARNSNHLGVFDNVVRGHVKGMEIFSRSTLKNQTDDAPKSLTMIDNIIESDDVGASISQPGRFYTKAAAFIDEYHHCNSAAERSDGAVQHYFMAQFVKRHCPKDIVCQPLSTDEVTER